VALLLVDIAHFHVVNDNFGRQAGDELLRRLAQFLAASNGGDERVARISADCFALLVDGVDSEVRLAHLLDELCDPAGISFKWNDEDLRLSMRGGVAVYPNDGRDCEALIGNAELAMRQAKASGQRYMLYEREMNARLAKRLTMESKLKRALEQEQFELYYQPQLRLRNSEIFCVEALIRWRDPDAGLVLPGLFIPMLEETGLIVDVGRWVVRQAVRDCLRWRAAGAPAIRVATNIAAPELRRDDLVEGIREIVADFGPGACGLDLEITESGLMLDIEGNIARLKALRELGVRIAIDDFGTGYSSLSYISRLPADSLKIDRSFVTSMVNNPDDFAVVSSIISLASGLEMMVIAEGVETQEQASMLSLLKCDAAQGYLYSRPVPADQMQAMLLAAR
jgi:diguanylate cyclase (GGDEF)-like protein